MHMKFFERFNNVEAYQHLAQTIRSKQFTAVFGAQKNEKAFIAADVDSFVLYVAADYVDAQQLTRDLNALGRRFVFLPHKEDVLLYKKHLWSDTVYVRNNALYQLLFGDIDGIVTCVDSLTQPLPELGFFRRHCQDINRGDTIDFAELNKLLVDSGYRRTDAPTAVGEYAIRGDIVEVVTPAGRYRLDFWDREIDSISKIAGDLSSAEKCDTLTIIPLFDTVGADLSLVEKLIDQKAKLKLTANAHARLDEILSELLVDSTGRVDNGWLIPFLPQSSLADYLPADTLVIYDEPKLIAQRFSFLYSEQDERIAHMLYAGEITPFHTGTLFDRFAVFKTYEKWHQLALQGMSYTGTFFHADAIVTLNSGAPNAYHANLETLKTDLNNYAAMGYEVAVLTGDLTTQKTVATELASGGIYLTDGDKFLPNASLGLLMPIAISRGYVSHSNRLVVLGLVDLGKATLSGTISKSKKQAFLSAEKGDFVVHEHHGIGMCLGTEKITTDGSEKDFIVVLYKGGDKLYVPAENSNSLSRYAGGENPTLSALGGRDFERVKAKVKASIKAMSFDLVALYNKRQRPRGFVYKVDDYLSSEFQQAFQYTETVDQLKCIEEINRDLATNKIMDRLLVGDVGFGKTEVAMRTAFAVAANGYQVAVLVPTTILAEQHYNNFVSRMKDFDINVACLNRFRTPEQQKAIIKDVKKGKTDILIGTHRLLSKDVTFEKLGLLILDEEQRFGVEHKEFIKNLKSSVDVLTLTATPIPRTLNMSLSGIRDISTISTAPVKRQAVQTFVTEQNDLLFRDVITRELGRGGQVFLLYNSVASIQRFAAEIRTLVPDAKIIVAHGQMEERDLEDAIYRFQTGQGNVLICTTIIENGIDIPNANTLIVCDADNFGLSTLYQLKGRVGRSDRLAYAYFTYRQGKILTMDAYKRLTSITQYSELGSGFKIAMKDLEIRGAGNLLGREQHGHMMKVGYEMYSKMLAEAVQEARGEAVDIKTDCEMQVDMEAYAPEQYIAASSERMEFYQQIASVTDENELETLYRQLTEVYGAMPRQVASLFSIAELKMLGSRCHIKKLTIKGNSAVLEFSDKSKLMTKPVFDAATKLGNRAKFDTTSPSVVIKSDDFVVKERLISAVKQFLSEVSADSTVINNP
jgi:transcription-repair coupling factor (superfamily II helicase)